MKILPAITVPFYEFHCPVEILDEIQHENLTFKKDHSNYATDNFYNQQLYEWIENCLEQIRNVHYSDSLKLKISSCWINKAKTLQTTHFHTHMNSIVSGVIYLSETSAGKTVFKFPNPWFHVENHNVLKLSKHTLADCFLEAAVTPEKGKMVVFPSSILHAVTENNSSKNRYTLAYNTFIKGKISDSDVTSRLEL